MGQLAGKIGSTGNGTCADPSHPVPVPYVTTLTTGSPNVFINGVAAAFVTSAGLATCGHATAALIGSPTVFVNGLPLHRVLDTGATVTTPPGPYALATGSANVIVG